MAECTILNMDLDANCWVVRPGRDYEYYEHFIYSKIAAIGHFDDFITKEGEISEDDFALLMREYYTDSAKKGLSQHTISANVNQVKKFLFSMEIGDLVFTIGSGTVVAGIITSNAYVSYDVVNPKIDDRERKDLNFKIRRDVMWGQSYNREVIPDAVKRSFKANQAVFSASEHLKSIYHWINTVFISDGTVYSSSRINQEEDIHHYSVTKFSEVLNKLEALATLVELNFENENLDSDISLDDIKNQLNALAIDDLLNLTTQQSFMSPGEYWTGFTGRTRVATIAFTLAICELLNVNPVFADEKDAHIAQVITAPVSTAVQKIKNDNNMDIVIGKLELEMPRQNKRVVEKYKNIKEQDFPDVEDSDKGTR
ncbi:hypothetical protein PTT65_21020 [Serratia ureilytica]|uniref:hypothetical protein n=1 Tax=Serratia TaxID=613 RepID=UPI001150FE5C|nr:MULTISPECIES: hypothetical protein [Serratia]MDM1844202.1 hypothetical protein [Serratia ureilytica]QDI50222.1 hypothetical protein FG174_00410 [Serratia marcescens]